MLHAKFQDHRTSGSGEKDFLRFLPYMGMAAILVMQGLKLWTDRRTTMDNGPLVSYKLTYEPLA